MIEKIPSTKYQITNNIQIQSSNYQTGFDLPQKASFGLSLGQMCLVYTEDSI